MALKSFTQEQEPALTLQDLIPGGKNFDKYRANLPKAIRWWGDKLIYTKGNEIIQVSLSGKKDEKVLLSLDSLNLKFKKWNKEITSISDIMLNTGSDIISVKVKKEAEDSSTSILYYSLSKDIFISGAELKYPDSGDIENLDYSPQGNKLAYTVGANLNIVATSLNGQKNASEIIKIKSEKEGISFGANNVHRNEFGITKGTFWSPKGNYLAFYKMDESMVGDYPLVDISAREAALKSIKYPMAGMNSHEIWLAVKAVSNPASPISYIKAETSRDIYLTNVAWSPDEKYIFIAEINRDQNLCKLKKYDAATGDLVAVLFEEANPKYVEPENPILFLKNNPNQFIWQSKRDGYNHIYIYDINGSLIKQLTKGQWDILSIAGFDEKGENLIVTSTESSPIEKHIYSINLKNGKRTKLSNEPGVHKAALNNSGRYVLDTYTSQGNPGKVAVIDSKTNSINTLYTADNPYKDITLPEITIGKLKADDGQTDLYYRLVKPTNFDATKKYPVVIYVYGGPHSQLVDNSWLGQARGWDIYMAEKGYLIFTLDNRGTSNRGLKFENITHRQLGIIETQDQMTGVDYLKTLPFVDPDRIGVHGWSYGGFMTLNLMLRHPETFKVGVAGGPVTDWKYYEIMYGERYMDSPQDNPEGYKSSSMIDKAGDLKGRLLLIHGDEDPVVVMQQSLQYLKSSIKSGTHPDFFIYPGHEHNMTGLDRVHLHEHITRYFDDFLK